MRTKVAVHNDWKAIWHNKICNWVDLNLIKAYVDYNKFGPTLDVELIILGLGICLTIPLPWTTDASRRRVAATEETTMADDAITYPVCPYCKRDIEQLGSCTQANGVTLIMCLHDDCRKVLGVTGEPVVANVLDTTTP